jgi:Ca2+-binding RTX toxin-like protein
VNFERLEFTGAGAFAGTGNARGNTLVGGADHDTLDGGLGADRMEGGAGNDTYFVNVVASADGLTPGDVIVEAAEGGTGDTVHSSVSYTLGATLEHLVLTGSLNINGTGNAGNNSLTGNDFNNVLSGGVGDDTLTGGTGNDTLNGGTGNDVAVFTGEASGWTFNQGPSGSIIAFGPSGDIDRLIGIELVQFGAGAPVAPSTPTRKACAGTPAARSARR